ncbi:DUF1871 family protein [Gracilibacillus caseinilyticus]|uniref:DUF1871 family protein n=1 Tax=Gracilibacillus caseinilyticus TaxID=2932256 RepID=A0ABY4ESI4_9BACI|nr:DUF1871 family protein [Gracilibacillus caseinilyticus]UOQ46833.1 DUF1871 family protein [Gracilibacillus caseinilyticus]
MSKEKYNEIFDVVKKVINEWDPIGVLPYAPDDEYKFEVAKVVTLLSKVENVEELSDGLAKIFKKALEWNFTKEECLPIAKKI